MKSRTLALITVITLSAALAAPVRRAAQEPQLDVEHVDSLATSTANPVPLINQPLVPDAAKPGGVGFTLTVNGTGFVAGAAVKWNGSTRITTFVSGSRLIATILASDIATAGTASVTVVNPTPGGGASNAAFFSITVFAPPLWFNRLDLNSGAYGADSVATGDFNGDGKVDLVVANDIAAMLGVGVFLSNGDGTFQQVGNYATDAYPDSVVVGDFNGDGKLDVAVRSQYSFTISVLLGNGDGTFQPFKTTATTACQGRLAEGDFNGDGKLDLACTSSSANNVAILLGKGDGTFQREVDYAVGSGADAIAVGDFNRDGRLDLAITDSSGVSIMLGNGDGSFQAPVGYATANVPADSVNAADFNGDGILDLAVPTQNSAVSIFLGNGDGTFKPPTSYPTASGGGARSTVADFNGDGNPDLAITPGDSSNQVSILLGSGDGTFQAPLPYGTGPLPLGVVAADFNGDGLPDLAVADNGASAVSVLLQVPGTGTFVKLNPASLDFGYVGLGSGSTLTTTLTNTGSTTLNITSIKTNSPFSQTNTCAKSVGAGKSCAISVTFKPSQSGTFSGAVSVSDDGGNSPQQVALSGIGYKPPKCLIACP
jgi:VCBS repeat protein/HYDIN/CFA65/VesB family protein